MRAVLGLLIVLGFAAAGGAGAWLARPADVGAEGEVAPPPPPEPLAEPDFIALPTEFIVPVLAEGRVQGHVVLTLGLRSDTLESEVLLQSEPMLRDRLLEALFRHAGAGGFDGHFTDVLPMNRLRASLNEAVSAALHPEQGSVLVMAINRRDL